MANDQTTHKLDTDSLLKSITDTLSLDVSDIDSPELFEKLLQGILSLSQGEYGFIGQLVEEPDGQHSLQCRAITNIAWNEEMEQVYIGLKNGVLRFNNMNSLYGAVITTKQPVICNQPESDARFNGVPDGHPPLCSFLGLPIHYAGAFLGVIGVANRHTGFDEEVVSYLAPYLAVCGNLIDMLIKNAQLAEVKQALGKYQKENQDHIELGQGYLFDRNARTVIIGSDIMDLTKNETKLLDLLVANSNQVVSTEHIENSIWKNGAISDSSVRSLLFRLRKKLPDLDIKTVSGIGCMLNI